MKNGRPHHANDADGLTTEQTITKAPRLAALYGRPRGETTEAEMAATAPSSNIDGKNDNVARFIKEFQQILDATGTLGENYSDLLNNGYPVGNGVNITSVLGSDLLHEPYLKNDLEHDYCTATVLAFWPDRSFTCVAESAWGAMTPEYLWNLLEEFGPPAEAKIVVGIATGASPGEPAAVDVTPFIDAENEIRFKIQPSDVTELYRMEFRQSVARRCGREYPVPPVNNLTPGDFSNAIPPLPQRTYTLKQIKAMPKFSGVYFAYKGGRCIYVGQSKNVPGRVSGSRKELAEADEFGVIKCSPEQTRRIESYYIGLLDPVNNCEHTGNNFESILNVIGREVDDGLTNVHEQTDGDNESFSERLRETKTEDTNNE